MSVFSDLRKRFLNASLEMSHPSVRVVHGIPVKRRPMRAYMDFVQRGGKMLPFLMDKLFPGMSGIQIFTKLAAAQSESLKEMASSLLVDGPPLLMEAVAEVLDVPQEDLLDNPAVGPNQLLDILEAFAEMNDLTDFFGRVSKRSPRP